MQNKMTKPHIILLGKLPPPFMGPSIATQIILNSSLKDRYDLIHLDTKAYDDLSEFGKWSIKKIFRNSKKYIELRRLIKRHNPSLVWIPVSQTTAGFLKDAAFIWISLLSGRKTLLHLRGSNFRSWLNNTSPLTRWFVRMTLKKCTAVIVLGEKLRYLFKEYFKEDMIFVVPNGADYTFPAVSSPSNGKARILYIANLQESKGIEDVLASLVLLEKKHSGRYMVDVIGGWRSDSYKAKCEQLIKSAALPVEIHTPDSNPDKFRYLSQSDIFVFTPRAPEGHPWVIVEAMAAGLPIISTDKGAITESVIHERNGFIVADASPVQIAGYLEKLIENPELRQRMGAESRKHYAEGFTEAQMVKKLTGVFETILQH